MTHRIIAHLEEGMVVVDEPLPAGIQTAHVVVEISDLSTPAVNERAQTESGFARSVLADPAEDVWEND